MVGDSDIDGTALGTMVAVGTKDTDGSSLGDNEPEGTALGVNDAVGPVDTEGI